MFVYRSVNFDDMFCCPPDDLGFLERNHASETVLYKEVRAVMTYGRGDIRTLDDLRSPTGRRRRCRNCETHCETHSYAKDGIREF